MVIFDPVNQDNYFGDWNNKGGLSTNSMGS